jgi:hypothetical protein
MRLLYAVLIALFMLIPSVVLADCQYNGRQYPEGTRIGVLVCQSGRWVVRMTSASIGGASNLAEKVS